MKRLLSFALLCAAGNLHANGGGYLGSMGRVGGFQPIGIDQVEMLSEHLEIDLHIEHAIISVEYLLHNPGKKIKIEAGFPVSETMPYHLPGKGGMADPKTRLGTAVAGSFKAFEAKLDGKPLDFELVADKLDLKKTVPGVMSDTVTGWYKVKFNFEAGETRKLRVTYKQQFLSSLSYLFSAAGLWRGPIRDGVVIVRPISRPKAEVAFNHPKRFLWQGDHWEWSFHDFEPTLEDDLQIQESKGEETQVFDSRELEGADSKGLEGFYVSHGGEWVNDRFRAKRWDLEHSGYQIRASSELAPEKDLNYGAENLRQRSAGRAWVEGVAGDGVGESLVITPAKPAPVRRIGIMNGYASSDELYEANGRVSALDVSVNGGRPVRVSIPDERLEHRLFYFDLPATEGLVKTITLTIAGVHPGKHFHDTAISRIVLVQALEKAPRIIPVR